MRKTVDLNRFVLPSTPSIAHLSATRPHTVPRQEQKKSVKRFLLLLKKIQEKKYSLLYFTLLYLGKYLHWFSEDYELLIERSLNGHATIARRLSHDHSLIAL